LWTDACSKLWMGCGAPARCGTCSRSFTAGLPRCPGWKRCFAGSRESRLFSYGVRVTAQSALLPASDCTASCERQSLSYSRVVTRYSRSHRKSRTGSCWSGLSAMRCLSAFQRLLPAGRLRGDAIRIELFRSLRGPGPVRHCQHRFRRRLERAKRMASGCSAWSRWSAPGL
jgi:hypothetical protein